MTDETKHTPGPWRAREYEDYMWEVTAQGPYGQLNLAEGIDEFDAHLIAAAPELLETLESYVGAPANSHSMAQKARYDKAIAAIAKSEGRL